MAKKEKLWRTKDGRKLYFWNWVDEGWNNEWAFNKADLKKVIAARFPSVANKPDLNVIWSTVRPLTQTEYNNIERNAKAAWY